MVRHKFPSLLSLGLAAGLLVAVPARPSGSVEVTYLANEGFLISLGETKLLIDALFPGIAGYAEPSDELRQAIAAGKPPFDGVDAVLATHFHDDHFGAPEVATFLAANTGALFVSTEQALAKLSRERGQPSDRARAVYPAEGASESVSIDGAALTLFNLHHGKWRQPPVQNLGFLIDLQGFTILHVGDTEITADEIGRLKLGEMGIDLVLLPAWYLTEPRWEPVVDEIGAARIAVMHLAEPGAPSSWFGSAGSRDARVQEIRDGYPAAWIPDAPMDSRSYPAGLDPD